VASTRPMLARMCGESHSANSAASLITPRQSALGFPDVGVGDGQLRKGDLPDTHSPESGSLADPLARQRQSRSGTGDDWLFAEQRQDLSGGSCGR
jgi:hypothetical protein